jgi:hypothetical protein
MIIKMGMECNLWIGMIIIIIDVFSSSVYGSATPTVSPTRSPSRSPITKAPSAPTSAPTLGCTSSDVSIWESNYYFSFDNAMNTCGEQSAGDRTIAATCLEKIQPTFSSNCINCEIDLIVCTKDNCLAYCVDNGQKNPNCVSCVQQYCDTAFTSCSSLNPDTCTGCVQVTSAPTLVNGLENPSLYGIIGGAVGFIIVVGIICWRCKCCTNDNHHVADQPPLTPISSQGSFKGYQQNTLQSQPSGPIMAPPGMGPVGFAQPQMMMMPQGGGGGYVQMTPDQQQQVMMLMMQQQQQQQQYQYQQQGKPY